MTNLGVQRKILILELLASDGQVLAKDLSERFGVSEDSIRRDLRDLSKEGLLQRVHGGALPASAAVAPFRRRTTLDTTAKQALATAALALLRPGQILLIDGGTTCAELVRQIPRDLALTVVTHSPSIAVELVDHPRVEVIMLGGQLFKHSIVNLGAATVEAMAHIRADLFFMGVTGVHPTEGLSTGHLEEAHIKRALAARAAETVVMASKSKLNAASSYTIGQLGLIQTLVLEADSSPALIREFQAAGLSVVLAAAPPP
ncbi:MAG: DeoR/GlpR family DNA-binding transcription regulator [Pseudomonas sp.]|uniref:DeoR/GlpR family DNA-binding transcription regulator n=1 Tax=Pseudomonas sp. TaxID=306 RepID=UPI003391C805